MHLYIFSSNYNPHLLHQCASNKAIFPTFNIDIVISYIAVRNKMYGETFAIVGSIKSVNSYTSDACIYKTNAPKMCRPEAITSFFNGAYSMGIRNSELTTEEITGSTEAVFETGIYEHYVHKGMLIDSGKNIVILHEENEQWKMHREIWKTDLPATQTKK